MRHNSGARGVTARAHGPVPSSACGCVTPRLTVEGRESSADGGSYAYAEGGAVAEALASVVGHNTQQFDDHDQMPGSAGSCMGAG